MLPTVNRLALDNLLSLLWCPLQGFTPAKRPRDARLGMTEEATKDEGLTKTGSKKSLLAPQPSSAKSSPGAVLPRPSIDPTMPGECSAQRQLILWVHQTSKLPAGPM